MKPVTLAVFNSREEAEPMRHLLCDAGIWAEVRLESDTQELLQFGRPSVGVKVEVPREDFEQALQLIYGGNDGDSGSQNGTWLPWITKESLEPRSQKPGPQ